MLSCRSPTPVSSTAPSAAMHGLKPVTLELGGKSPQLVFFDADPELAAACIPGRSSATPARSASPAHGSSSTASCATS
jgi:hypothetical protein